MAERRISGDSVSASLRRLIDGMASQEFVDFVHQNKLDGVRNKLKMMLNSISGVLNDAERKQLTDSDVRQWFGELQEVIHDANDLLDEIRTEALRCIVRGRSGSSSSSRSLQQEVREDFSPLIKYAAYGIRESLVNRLEYIVNNKDVLGSVEGVETIPFRGSSESRSLPRLVEDSFIIGRNADCESIINMLLSDQDGHKISVIPIVGMGGIGKTAVARLVFNDKRAIEQFDTKLWITVGNEFNVFTFAKQICQLLTAASCTGETFGQLQLRLKEFLEGKKLLSVLDDVWNMNHTKLYVLRSLFESASHGSKIIVTTRSLNVGKIMGTVPNYHLRLLSEEDSWKLLLIHAFRNVKPSACRNFENVDRKIVKICGGLPLAIERIGNLLVHDLHKIVAGGSCLRLKGKTHHVSQMARKTHYIVKLEAENNLLRTLLQEVPRPGLNMERPLLQEVPRPGLNMEFLIHPKSFTFRRRSYVDDLKSHDSWNINEVRKLDLFGKLKNLRYLNLSWTKIKQIPYAIGDLTDLRYLDLSHTQVEAIPETVGNLQSLDTLLLKACRKLNCLPTNIDRLFNLCLLDIRSTSLKEMPRQISNLRYLKITSDFVVERNSISDIQLLGEFQNMCDNLSIRSLEKVANIDDVSEANLKDTKHITNLSLEWVGDTNNSQKDLEVLNRLKQLIDLQQLSLINYGGISFPDWIGEHSFSHLVCMWLSKCIKCHNLPPLGQLPSLKSLIIDGFDMVEIIGDEFYINGSSPVAKPFKSLEKLSFRCMPRWKEWSFVGGGVFSQLKELHLLDCPSLTLNAACFPDSLPSLTYLCISKCQLQVMASLLSCQLPLLSSLYIGYCPELESFPERRLPTNIHAIEIFGCKNLKLFLEEGWPANLKSLSIGSCGKLFAPHMQWNLQTLTSLASLDFNCIDEVVNSFPEGGQLPTSLTSLTLCRLHNLKSLNGKALQQLTSLERLSISYCQQLHCMPEEGLPATLSSLHLSCLDNLESLSDKAFGQLASLEKLLISYCPRLLCLPEEGLPASLSQLTIKCCRFLNPRCQREIGEDWPMIAHIPRISIIQY